MLTQAFPTPALLAAVVLGAAPVWADPVSDALAERYWVPRESLAPAVAAQVPEYCAGSYQLPPRTLGANVDPATLPIEAEAQRGSLWVNDRIELTGAVTLRQGDRVVRAPAASVDLDTREVKVSESVTLADPDVVLAGASAQANIDTRAATLTDVEFLLGLAEMRGDAVSAARDEGGNLQLAGAQITRCPPGHRGWHFGASSIEVPAESVFARARNATLRIGPVPVFYAPYIRFPVSDERQSGWLFPTFGYSNEDGLDLAVPYYLNLAPNYDATIVPRLLSERGAGFESEFRHRSSWSNTVLIGAYLPDDDLFDGTFERDDFFDAFPDGEFEPEDRWLYGIEHDGRRRFAGGELRSIVDYRAVSDRDYFRDLGSDLATSAQIQLARRAELRYTRGDLLLRLWGLRFQRLDEITVDPYARLPELQLRYQRSLLGPLEASVNAHWAAFDRDTDNLRGLAAVTGTRAHVEPRLRLPLNWSFGFVTATAGLRYTHYDLDDNNAGGISAAFDDSRDRSIGFASLDAGLVFERELSLFGTRLLQTLEPRAFYLRQEFADQSQLPLFDAAALTFNYNQLFRDNRFAGVDRIGDANQLATGVTTRFLDVGTGREYLRASLGQIWYFEDRRVTLFGGPSADDRHGTSALAGEVLATLAQRWRAQLAVIFDPDDNEVDEGAAFLSYRDGNRRLLNLGYRYQRLADIDQTDFSVYWPLSRRFGFVGRWNYDLETGRTIERFGGLEYNDCCWQLRLVARRFIDAPSAALREQVDPDEGVFVQIVFKGLAGFGNRLESILTQGIRNYRSPVEDSILTRPQQ
ncbi:MAG: LPS-assembly protein LptD [Pseudomonadota bacterium]